MLFAALHSSQLHHKQKLICTTPIASGTPHTPTVATAQASIPTPLVAPPFTAVLLAVEAATAVHAPPSVAAPFAINN